MTPETQRFITRLTPHCLGHQDWLFSTYLCARDVIERGIPGDFVECGVYAGAHCAVMARAILDAWKDKSRDESRFYSRHVHLFDSFQGIPRIGPEDTDMTLEGNPPGSASCGIKDVKLLLRSFQIPDELLVYHPGWFSETLPPCSAEGRAGLGKIALLRIDCDLYESTRLVMHHLYPLVSTGGWIIGDDWNLAGFRKAVHEFVAPRPIYWQKEK